MLFEWLDYFWSRFRKRRFAFKNGHWTIVSHHDCGRGLTHYCSPNLIGDSCFDVEVGRIQKAFTSSNVRDAHHLSHQALFRYCRKSLFKIFRVSQTITLCLASKLLNLSNAPFLLISCNYVGMLKKSNMAIGKSCCGVRREVEWVQLVFLLLTMRMVFVMRSKLSTLIFAINW
jgi:hypothetical protein